MTSFLVFIILVLVGIAVWQLTKIFDLTQIGGSSDNDEIANDRDNSVNGYLMFAFVGLDVDSQAANRMITTALGGVFVGAATWWYALSTGINIFRKKFRLRQLLMINRISGIIIIVIGLISFFEGVWRFLAPFLN